MQTNTYSVKEFSQRVDLSEYTLRYYEKEGLIKPSRYPNGIANVKDDIAGSASSVVNVVHQIGSSVGLSITIALTAGIASPIDSYNHSVYVLLVLAIISLIFCFNIDHITKNN